MKKIKKNFLVISQFNRDLSWIPEYTDNYLIYDRSPEPTYPDTIDQSKVIRTPNVGYNSYDYFKFIVDHYDNLPDVTIFAKAWTWPRHVSKEYFERVMNNEYFTPLTDYKMHQDRWPLGFFSPDGLFCELNTDAFLTPDRPTKYVHGYNDFLKFCFKDPLIPRYRMFAPGGDYIVPKANILKLPKVFYENLKLFTSHHHHCGETHIIERSMITLWCGNFEISENMLKPLSENFEGVPRYDKPLVPTSEKALKAFRRKAARFLERTATMLDAKSI
jgi:hypothetical protein